MEKYFRSHSFRKLLHRYEDMRDNGVSSYLEAEELTDIAEYYYSMGQKNNAMEAIDLALEIFPGTSAPLAFKARMALVYDNDPDEATRILEQINDKSDLEYIYTNAEIMFSYYSSDKVDAYLQQHLYDDFGYSENGSGNNSNENEDAEDFILDVANLFADYEEMRLAKKWLSRSHLTDTDDYKEVLGRVLISEGKFEESEKLFNELIDKDPYSERYWNHLASSQFLHNKFNDSISSSEYSIAINPNDEEAILNKANSLFSIGNYQEALIYYKKFTELQPDNEVGEMFQGITLNYQNRPEEALLHLQKALSIVSEESEDLSPNYQQILQEIAFVESHLGHLDNALQYMDRLEEVNPSPLNDVMRGYFYLEQGKTRQAMTCFQGALTDSESTPEIVFHIAIAIYDHGFLNTAYKMFKSLISDAPNDWNDGYAYYARCCYERGDMEQYSDALKTAITKNPEEARMVLSDLYPEGTEPADYPLYPLNSTLL